MALILGVACVLVAATVLVVAVIRTRPPSVGACDALLARLRRGAITPAEYRRAMALLAADDAVEHPLTVPPER